jgi:hypothetical protein
MPDKTTVRKARADARAGKSASTQAGEFVKAEIEKIRHGVHGARSAKQAIAIGLSEARRAGIKVRPGRNASSRVKTQAKRDEARSKSPRPTNRKRSRATLSALRKEPRSTVSKKAMSNQSRSAAARRSHASRSAAAKKAAATRKRNRR